MGIAPHAYQIGFIRLAPDKFLTQHRDFLLGNADRYTGLAKDDLQQLIHILDQCHQQQLPVVLTFLSLPGSRWLQNNQQQDDLRLWQGNQYLQQAVQFWVDVATALKDHPAVVGYDLLNEPHPERMFNQTSTQIANVASTDVTQKLNSFYALLVQQIRAVDPKTTIIIEASAYADPAAFHKLTPIDDNNILYSFHMYEPFDYTNKKRNQARFSYPGQISTSQGSQYWDKNCLHAYLKAVADWQNKHQIPSQQILVGEFGAYRGSKGLAQYLTDLIALFNQHQWHWAVYAFREDTWPGMDYELGQSKLPWKYWQAQEQGKPFELTRSNNHAIFQPLVAGWQDKANKPISN